MTAARFDRLDLAAIAAGGLVGASVRWLITETGSVATDGYWFEYEPNTSAATRLTDGLGFPWHVLIVNVLGCLLLGAVIRLRQRNQSHRRLLLGVGTGFCGSLTTFSTFAVDLALRFRGESTFPGWVSWGRGLPDTRAGKPLVLQSGGVSPFAQGWLYLIASLVLGAAAFVIGRRIAGNGDP